MKKYILICSIALGWATASVAQQFTEMTDVNLYGVYGSTLLWGDYDNDGDLDILLTGDGNGRFLMIYRNNGNKTFTPQNQIQLSPISDGDGAWGDYDNDGDLDVLLSGSLMSKIYKNNGNNSFTEQTQIELTPVHGGMVAWGDYDNDGYLDVLLAGYNGFQDISKVYRNNGNNTFTVQSQIDLLGHRYGNAAWRDYDNDGDLDIVLSSMGITNIYSNNGDHTFTNTINLSGNITAWGDYDNDGDLDILATHCIYRNDGNNNFTEQFQIQIEGGGINATTWGDYDNDGYLDVFVSGYLNGTNLSKVYHNNGNNTFTEQANILNLWWNNIAWGDYDNDGDLDILLTGFTNNTNTSKIYRNNATKANSRPLVPTNLQTINNGDNITFSWNTATDVNQAGGLSYNLYVYKEGDATTYKQSPHAFAQTNTLNGTRLIAQIGSIQNNSYTLRNLSDGTYKWSVQAIDACFAGGRFATEKNVTVQCNAPTETVKNITIKDITNQSFVIDSVVATNTTAFDGYVVFVNDSDKWTTPTNNTIYTANTRWQNAGQQCVYAGNKNDVGIFVHNLDDNKTYYIKIYTYNQCDNYIKYETIGLTTPITTAPAQFQKQNDIYFGATATNGSWGDYDNDGDLDFYSVLNYSYDIDVDSSYRVTYTNNGNNSFTPSKLLGGTLGSFAGTAQWADYDNDNDIDISLTGKSSYIWGHWEQVCNPCFECEFKCEYGLNGWWCWNDCIATCCYTDEYFQDYIQEPIFRVYKNDNNGSLEADNIPISFSNVYISKWGDYDNDGDLDILAANTGVYQNTGGEFAIKYNIAGNDWGDYDNDGDLDVLSWNAIYQNKGNNFVQISNVGGNAWGDYDNDGDLDVLANDKVYQNTGDSLVQIANVGGLTWGDYDNDGFLDILSRQYVYKNDGQGHFVPVQYFESAYGWVDYDNDGRLDVWAKDEDGSFTLYRNATEQANITPAAPTNLQATQYGNYVEFTWDAATDANQTGGWSYNLYVYNNDTKTYAKSPQSLVGVNDSLNGKRLLVQRGDIQGTSYKLKLLDGNYSWSVQAIDASFEGGSFAPEQNFTFECIAPTDTINNLVFGNITARSITIKSVALSSNQAGDYVVFINDTNSFTPPTYNQTFIADTNWQHKGQQCVYVGNNLQPQINITQLDDETTYYIKVYTYNRCKKYSTTYYDTVVKTTFEHFTDMYNLLENVNGAYTPIWGDYDNDGDLDILLTAWGTELLIYRNNSNSSFTRKIQISTHLYNNAAAWGDYDNDGDLDILLTGVDNYSKPISTIYRNEANDSFIEQSGMQIIGTTNSSVEWGDYDNDGDLDFLLSGSSISGKVSKIYSNNGNSTFTDQNHIQLMGIDMGNATWGDYDNDGDLDILISGKNNSGIDFSKVYRNNGNSTFTEQIQIQIAGAMEGKATWGDYDNDRNLDILITGRNNQNENYTKIYRNNGDNTFAEQNQIKLVGVFSSDVAWGDYDNDGDLDILISGQAVAGLFSKIYRNNNNNNFIEEAQKQLAGAYHSALSWGDYDNDSDLDILLFGRNSSNNVSKIYRNNNAKSNTIPNAPTNLKSTINNDHVTLTWNIATDANQTAGHSYNVYIRNTDNNKLVVTPMANTTTGKRLVASRGSIQTTTKTYYLPKGNYAWAVQAIDNNFEGSPFSAEQSFSVTKNIETIDTLSTEFNISPNPAGEKLLINVGTSTDFTVQLIGIDGTMYEQQTFTKQSHALLTRLPRQSGLYFVRVITPTGVGTQKVMIQRK